MAADTNSSPTPDSLIDAEKAIQYWNEVPTSLAGIMGGFPQISRIDIQSSTNLLTKLGFRRDPKDTPVRGADCGAGIGRITKDLLSHFCSTVDIIEPVEKFTNAITSGKDFASLRGAGKIGDVYNVGLEHWTPKEGAYGLVWNQWCVGHLRDADLVAYLRRCAAGISAPNGFIIVKENIASGAEDIFDDQDNSVTRTEAKFKKLFKEAGLVVVKEEIQRGFPSSLGLFKVKTFALRPESWVAGGGSK
ncbi:hypothetical protein L211DRAFT_818549 [Terfezia boudieri ATCC MYA-4762]|uniref:Alpha N-terminal protein methyltransferase 1 n=1 Tax=Terfezia boudieri ATCC MYA-4762 TaxID=1051890 RepID=A0A3N4MK13_9PEZI|nr:hypothetical protein L211DRAFT_818549 [Terfezia boudieri ATCC MYA-4762]